MDPSEYNDLHEVTAEDLSEKEKKEKPPQPSNAPVERRPERVPFAPKIGQKEDERKSFRTPKQPKTTPQHKTAQTPVSLYATQESYRTRRKPSLDASKRAAKSAAEPEGRRNEEPSPNAQSTLATPSDTNRWRDVSRRVNRSIRSKKKQDLLERHQPSYHCLDRSPDDSRRSKKPKALRRWQKKAREKLDNLKNFTFGNLKEGDDYFPALGRLLRYDDKKNDSEKRKIGDYTPDVVSSYDAPDELPRKPFNNENAGRMFINGHPFWRDKVREPPQLSLVSKLIIEEAEGRFTLTAAVPPPQFDVYADVEDLMQHDKGHFEEKVLTSNAIRSTKEVTQVNIPEKRKPEFISIKMSDSITNVQHQLSIQDPTVQFTYSRRNPYAQAVVAPLIKKDKKKKGRNVFAVPRNKPKPPVLPPPPATSHNLPR